MWSMWGMASFTVTIGAELRGVLMLAGYPSEAFVESFFLGGKTFSDLSGPSFVALGTILALTLGFALVANRSAPAIKSHGPASPNALQSSLASEPFVVVVAASYLMVGAVCTYLYTRGVGGIAGSIGERRGAVNADGTTTGTFGYYEFLAGASAVGAMLLLIYWLSAREHLGPGRIFVVAVAFTSAFGINWVTTTRADLVYVSAAALAAIVIIRKHVPWITALLVGTIVLGAIGGLTAARAADDVTRENFSVSYGIDSGILNRNAYDLGKTLRVIDAVPEVLPYENGGTITRFALAPIPRSFWPEKPIITPGPIVGARLYGTTRSGVPPGLSGELVWNFGRLLAVAFAFLFGLLLGGIEKRWYPRNTQDLTGILIYLTVFFTFGKDLLGVSVGNAVFGVFGDFLLLVPLLVLVRLRPGPRRDRYSPVTM